MTSTAAKLIDMPAVFGGFSSRSNLGRAMFRPVSSERTSAVVEVSGDAFRPLVSDGDLVRIDFTRTEIAGEGLYVLTMGRSSPDWIGIRRFQRIPGQLLISNSPGQWETLTDEAHADIRIVGKVLDVYQRDVTR